MALTLIIGNKNYSSWSLRPWLALTAAGVPFEERLLPIGGADFAPALATLGVPARVPVLLDGGLAVWDSLAIIEYAAERHPDAEIWPRDVAARALARCAAAEMHSGFHRLRRHLPMNLWRPPAPFPLAAGVAEEVARASTLWRTLRARFGAGGDFLFSRFSAADAMFAPLATRLRTYQVPLHDDAARYVEAIHAHPAFLAWRGAALDEPWVIAEDEVDWPEVKRGR